MRKGGFLVDIGKVVKEWEVKPETLPAPVAPVPVEPNPLAIPEPEPGLPSSVPLVEEPVLIPAQESLRRGGAGTSRWTESIYDR